MSIENPPARGLTFVQVRRDEAPLQPNKPQHVNVCGFFVSIENPPVRGLTFV